MEPVRIEFLMVDKLSQRLDKAEEKIDELKKKTSSANDEMRKLDRSGLSLEGTVKKLAAAFTIKELVGNITKVRGEFSSWRLRSVRCWAARRRPMPCSCS